MSFAAKALAVHRAKRAAETQKRRQSQRRDRAAIRSTVNELKSNPCEDCGGTFDPICMDFDHRPGEKKIGSVSSMLWAGLDRVLAEIAKCDLVCANCHRLRTLDRRCQP